VSDHYQDILVPATLKHLRRLCSKQQRKILNHHRTLLLCYLHLCRQKFQTKLLQLVVAMSGKSERGWTPPGGGAVGRGGRPSPEMLRGRGALPRRESMSFPAADGTSRIPAKLQISGKELLCSGEDAQTSWTPTSNRSFSRADPEELRWAGRGAAGAGASGSGGDRSGAAARKSKFRALVKKDKPIILYHCYYNLLVINTFIHNTLNYVFSMRMPTLIRLCQ
jgi:hypothetical protein